MYIMA